MPSTPPRFSCEFVHRNCSRSALFETKYLRTNRMNHTKIMRCFPHCCPVHRQRSYCGSTISVEVQSSGPQTKSSDEAVVVYGRFRPHESTALQVGDRVSEESILSSLQSRDPSNGEWIQSRATRTRSPSGPRVFEINPSGRWYYRWSGAATSAMPTTKHIFEALTFRYTSSTELEVVAIAASPPFSLMSFRRGSTAKKSVFGDSVRSGGEDILDEKPRTPPEPSNSDEATTEAVAALGKLMRWLQKIPASTVGSPCMLVWERVVFDTCTELVAAARSGLHHHNPVLPAQVLPSDMSGPSNPESLLSFFDAIDTVVRLFLNEWIEGNSTREYSGTIDRCVRDGFGTDVMKANYRTWVSEAETRAKRFLHANSTAVWSYLLSMVDDHDQTAPRGGEFGYGAFVSQCRQRAINENSISRRRLTISSRENDEANLPWGLQSASRVWICGIKDVSIELDTVSHRALSILTVMQFWKHLSCIRVDFTGLENRLPQLSLASVFNPSIKRAGFTQLLLDGQYRWFSSLPNGDATAGSTLMGFALGDYVGRTTPDGAIEVTTFLWPTTVGPNGTAAAYAWHWMLDSSFEERGAPLTTSVIIETAKVSSSEPLPFETMPVAEKLCCIGSWEYVCQVRLSYRDSV